MAGRFSLPRETALDADGNPIAGAKLAFFESGTTTPQDTFSDDDLTVPNDNPVIADSAGRFGDIFLTGADYKVTLSDADDVVIWTADPVRSPTPKSSVVRDVTTTTVLTSADDGKLIAADATGGAFIITLPAAATAGNGFEVSVIKIDSSANVVTVDANGAETINGDSDFRLPEQFAAVSLRCDGTTWYAESATPSSETLPLSEGYITGLAISNNGTDADHDVDVATGRARSDDNLGNIVLSSSITKRIDASFAEGSNQGGLDTGSVAADTIYYVWAIGKADGTADALFSLSSTSPTLPSGFSLKRLIGLLRTDDGANLFGFTWSEDGVYDWALITTTSVTSINVPGIPSGVTELELDYEFSLNTGSQSALVRLGDSGGIESTGYACIVAALATGTGGQAHTDGFRTARTANVAAGDTVGGQMRIRLLDDSTNTWIAVGSSDEAVVAFTISGRKSLSAELSQFEINTTNGTAELDVTNLRYRFSGHSNPRAV